MKLHPDPTCKPGTWDITQSNPSGPRCHKLYVRKSKSLACSSPAQMFCCWQCSGWCFRAQSWGWQAWTWWRYQACTRMTWWAASCCPSPLCSTSRIRGAWPLHLTVQAASHSREALLLDYSPLIPEHLHSWLLCNFPRHTSLFLDYHCILLLLRFLLHYSHSKIT